MVAPARATGQEDRVLMARLVAGDERALGEAYDDLSPLVFGLARRVTGDDVAAEDVCQEVFVHLWTHADQVDLSRCSLRGWLSVLAHRRSVDHVRRSARSRRREERTAPDLARFEAMADLADDAVAAERTRRARDAVAALPAEQRTVVLLAFWGGRSYREAALELSIPEGTAKSRARLALAKLSEALADLGVEEGAR